MSAPLKLVIFDVDGTLIDSQHEIVGAMDAAFASQGRPAPVREATLGIVGLSLPEAMAVLAPDAGLAGQSALATAYKQAYHTQRTSATVAAPLYPGAREAIATLERGGFLLSIATGKARRGLDHALAAHGIAASFLGTQTADDAPSKPHPQMVLNCLSATGADGADAVMVGDTAFDMEMARAAGCRAVGVGWGYHDRARLLAGGAEVIVPDFAALGPAVTDLLGTP